MSRLDPRISLSVTGPRQDPSHTPLGMGIQGQTLASLITEGRKGKIELEQIELARQDNATLAKITRADLTDDERDERIRTEVPRLYDAWRSDQITIDKSVLELEDAELEQYKLQLEQIHDRISGLRSIDPDLRLDAYNNLRNMMRSQPGYDPDTMDEWVPEITNIGDLDDYINYAEGQNLTAAQRVEKRLKERELIRQEAQDKRLQAEEKRRQEIHEAKAESGFLNETGRIPNNPYSMAYAMTDPNLPYEQRVEQAAAILPKLQTTNRAPVRITTTNEKGERVSRFVNPVAGDEYPYVAPPSVAADMDLQRIQAGEMTIRRRTDDALARSSQMFANALRDAFIQPNPQAYIDQIGAALAARDQEIYRVEGVDLDKLYGRTTPLTPTPEEESTRLQGVADDARVGQALAGAVSGGAVDIEAARGLQERYNSGTLTADQLIDVINATPPEAPGIIERLFGRGDRDPDDH